MTTRHTPGPWAHRNGRIYSVDREQLTIAHVARSVDGDYSPANGQLIAAAPELLDACMAMLEWDDREKDHAVDFYARMDLCRAAFNKARAAIAKATGEHQ